MTPFGSLLRFYRQERGIPLKVLAVRIGISQKNLSALESGARRPPEDNKIADICTSLTLSADERHALLEAARFSSPLIRLPGNANPQEYRLVHRVIASLRQLSAREITAIHTVLDGLTRSDNLGDQG